MKLKSLLTLLALIILFSCNRNVVQLDYTNATGEVPALGNLIFRFNKALVNDSMLNRWDSASYITFNPALPGRFRWEAPDQLVFSPARPLAPATSYKAAITDEVLRFSAFDRVGNPEEVNFSTPALRLENTNVTWVMPDPNSNVAYPQADLYFNYDLDPAQLQDRITLVLDGKPSSYQMITMSPDSKITIRLHTVKPTDKDIPAAIKLKEGLVPGGGSNATKEAIETNVVIPSPFNLTINDLTTEHNGSGGEVYIKASQQMAPGNLSAFIKIDPAVKFTTDVTDDGFVIRSGQFDADKSYTLTLAEGLRGRIGGILREQYTSGVAFGELEPSVSFGNSKAIYLAGQGSQQVELKVVNVPKIRVIISKIYESNLLFAERFGYYPKDRGNEEAYYEDEYNPAQPTTGDIIFEQEIDTRSLPKYGNSRLLNLNIEDKLADMKGIYHIKVRSLLFLPWHR